VPEFLEYAGRFATQARDAGQYVNGTVGQLIDATIYRSGGDYLLVQGNTIMSYVPRAEAGRGIVAEWFRLGGK